MGATRDSPETAAPILIVDDDPAMCQLLTDLLRDEGYLVEVAYDGDSAIEKYQKT
ncbi:MAG TPA: response regulator, partial [Acidobacteriota bacterium]|nr:response regulator [Acidobacteriota bacterium]